jgi:hypothetical protein
MAGPLQLALGHRRHRLGQVDPHRQAGRADQARCRDQDSAGATSHIEHPHAVTDTGQGQQPPRHLVEEADLVIACGDPAEQAGSALLGRAHVHPTLPRLD